MSRIHQGLQRALHEAERQTESGASPVVAHQIEGSVPQRSSKLAGRDTITPKESSRLAELARNPPTAESASLPQLSFSPSTQEQISTLYQR